jgi:Fe2+ transport system protein B
MATDLVISSCLGAVFGLGIIFVFSKYPGKPFDYGADTELSDSEVRLSKKNDDYNNNESSANDIIKNINEDEFVNKTCKLRERMGISEEVVRKAVRKSKNDVLNKKNIEDQFDYYYLLEWIILIIAIFISIYAINHSTGGDLMDRLRGLFPLEFETLGLHHRY